MAKKTAKKASAVKKSPAKKKQAPKASAPAKASKGAASKPKAVESTKPVEVEKPKRKRVRPSRAKKSAPVEEVESVQTVPAEVDGASVAEPDVLPNGEPAGEVAPTPEAAPVALPAEDPGRKVLEMRGKRTLRTVRDIAGEKLEDIMGLVDEVEEARYRYEKSKETTKGLKENFEELSASLHRVLLDIRKIANGESNLPLLDNLDTVNVSKAIEELVAAMARADYALSVEVASGLSHTDRAAALAWAKAEEVRLSYVKAGDSVKAMLVVVPALPVVLVRREEAHPSAAELSEAKASEESGETVTPAAETVEGEPETAADVTLPVGSVPKTEYLREALLTMLEPESVPAVEALELWSDADKVAAYVWASNPDAAMDQAPEIVKLLTVAPAAEDLAESFGAGEPGDVTDTDVPDEVDGLEGVGFDEPDNDEGEDDEDSDGDDPDDDPDDDVDQDEE